MRPASSSAIIRLVICSERFVRSLAERWRACAIAASPRRAGSKPLSLPSTRHGQPALLFLWRGVTGRQSRTKGSGETRNAAHRQGKTFPSILRHNSHEFPLARAFGGELVVH